MEPMIFLSCGSLKLLHMLPKTSLAFFPHSSVKFCSSSDASTCVVRGDVGTQDQPWDMPPPR